MAQGTFGPDLNLDELLGEPYVRHYLRLVDSGSAEFYVSGEAPVRFGSLPDLPDTGPGVLHGTGPDSCSASFALAVQPEFVWDVCGYYRRLGVPWWATRRELRIAYTRRRGADSVRLTNAFRVLVNALLRQSYDLASPLRPFLADPETEAAIKRAAWDEARRRGLTGTPDEIDAVLAEQGYKRAPDQPLAGRGDAMREQEKAQPGHDDASTALGASLSPWERRWSWYTTDGVTVSDTGRLEEWQALLRREFAARGVSESFAVGFCAGSHVKSWHAEGGGGIVFLGSHAEPTDQLAVSAVIQYLRSLPYQPS